MDDAIDRLRAALAERYAIVREVGAGGMATVYLAEDLKHHRHVAVKVLRPELAAILGADRFLREIEVTANLQHPNILALYDSGEADRFLYYVMPYIEGESLRDRLNREKQLSIDATLEVGRAVAAALAYAHERDVIHRDIKPANILLHAGQALVADFGIALAVREAGGQRLTETGLSLGTPHYMSPEQVSGDRELDGRSDQYSLAATLYEALAGEPPFTGVSAQSIVTKILTERAPLAMDVRESVPLHVSLALQKALEKLPADRFPTVDRFAHALTHADAVSTYTTGGVTRGVPARPMVAGWRTALPWAVSAVALVVAAAALLMRPAVPAAERVAFVVRADQELNQLLALSPDGRQLVMSGQERGLLLRSVDAPRVTTVAGSGNRVRGQPVFSPDGAWLAFLDVEDRELQRVPITGGTAVPITKVPLLVFGLSWGADDTLVWGQAFDGLWATAVGGGAPVQWTVPDTAAGELGHWYPQFLPGGTRVLFSTYRAPIDSASIEVLDIATGERTVLFRGGAHAQYIGTGHIVYARGETLWAIAFDPERARVTGAAVPVLENVSYDPINARSGAVISDDGTLAYIEASVWNSEGDLVWVDRRGAEQPLAHETGVYADPVISPDGSAIALVRTRQGEPDVWVYDADGGAEPVRVSRAEGLVANPLWAPDGRELIYSRERRLLELVRRDWQAGGAAVPIRVAGTGEDTDVYAYGVTPDGRLLIGTQSASWDIWTVPLDGSASPVEYRVTEFQERNAALSLDGRWVAYESDAAGPWQIWVQPYPAADATRRRWQVTRGGGTTAQWGPGSELFHLDGPRLMSVRIDPVTGAPGAAVELFSGPYVPGTNYAVSPDGQRFLMIRPREDDAFRREVTVVLNWFDELRAKLAGN